jgi:menaquinone reductase, multiheme cytochrome c subunit
MEPFFFPSWVNQLRPALGIGLVCVPAYLILVIALGASPWTTDVGYAPTQPVAYSHGLHAGELGIDCRYCHNTVESAAHAAIPPTQTCLNCHQTIRSESERLVAVRLSLRTGRPIAWRRVHDLPDYVYFDHSAHVRRGIGCVSCHGRVDTMDVVHQAEPLSMGWCLDCHRNPQPHLRPLSRITDLGWTRDAATAEERELLQTYDVRPSTDCNTCHR